MTSFTVALIRLLKVIFRWLISLAHSRNLKTYQALEVCCEIYFPLIFSPKSGKLLMLGDEVLIFVFTVSVSELSMMQTNYP